MWHSCSHTLTSEVFSGSCEQAVEDVEGSFIFGLSNGPRLLQKVWEQSEGLTKKHDQEVQHVNCDYFNTEIFQLETGTEESNLILY